MKNSPHEIVDYNTYKRMPFIFRMKAFSVNKKHAYKFIIDFDKNVLNSNQMLSDTLQSPPTANYFHQIPA